MRTIVTFFLLLVSLTLYSQKYKVVANISHLKAVDEVITKQADTINYFAPAFSYFIKIPARDEISKAPEGYIVVQFDSVYTTGINIVKKGKMYFLKKEVFNSYSIRYHSGVDYGALVIPFKLRFNPGSVSPGVALGPYIGYKLGSRSNTYTSFIATLGLTGVSLNDVNSENVRNVMGLTYGGGVIINVNNKFQVGALIGADYIGAQGKDWDYQNKPWISMAIGFTFLR